MNWIRENRLQVYVAAICLAYAADAVRDGITFSKAPQGRDLEYLWHGLKYLHVVLTLITGAMIWDYLLSIFYGTYRTYSNQGPIIVIDPVAAKRNFPKVLLELIVSTAIAWGTSQFIVWPFLYAWAIRVDWPDWAAVIGKIWLE